MKNLKYNISKNPSFLRSIYNKIMLLIYITNKIIFCSGIVIIFYIIYSRNNIIDHYVSKKETAEEIFKKKVLRCSSLLLTSFEHDGKGDPLLLPVSDGIRSYLGYYSNSCYLTHKKQVDSGKRITDQQASMCLSHDISIRFNEMKKEFKNLDYNHICALIGLHYNIDKHYKFVKNKNGLTKNETTLFKHLKEYNDILKSKNINQQEFTALSLKIAIHWKDFNRVNGIINKGIERRRNKEVDIFFKL